MPARLPAYLLTCQPTTNQPIFRLISLARGQRLLIQIFGSQVAAAVPRGAARSSSYIDNILLAGCLVVVAICLQ